MKSTKYIQIKDIPIILHTIDSYSIYWDYWFYFFNKHCSQYFENVIFCPETKIPSFHDKVKVFHTGHGEWGKRLMKILENLDCKYIFYMQEDFWPISVFPFTQQLCNLFQKDNLDCFRISSLCNYYLLDKLDKNIYQYKQFSPYTMSHQFSMWDKDFFYNALLPNEDPWTNENEGSIRINAGRPHKIYYIPSDWYHATVRSGKLTEIGKIMKQEVLNCQQNGINALLT